MKRKPSRIEPMDPRQALTLAGLVLDFELESSPPEADQWRNELRSAKMALDSLAERSPAGKFFLAAGKTHIPFTRSK